jgi:cytochrome bd-type quinol oxidase subunit 2
MRYTIRLLTFGTLLLFVVALWVADQGERAVATTRAQRYPGLGEFFVLWALLALALLLFLLLSAIGIALARRQRDQPWAIAIALIVMGIGALYLGSFVPPGGSAPRGPARPSELSLSSAAARLSPGAAGECGRGGL